MILSPSDVRDLQAAAEVTVGGRAQRVGDHDLIVFDSVCRLKVACAFDAPPELDGCIVALRGEWTAGLDGFLDRAALVSTHGGRPNRDVARLAGGVGAALAMRARALHAVRATFAARGFLEVETPTLVPCPGLDSHLDAFAIAPKPGAQSETKERALTEETPRDGAALPPSLPAPRFADEREQAEPTLFLATSPEYQMKRLLVGGVPRCFQLGRAYREGEIGGRHNPEFTMLEWYRAFGSMEDVMTDTEDVVRAVVAACAAPSSTLHAYVAPPRFARLRVADAFRDIAGVSEDAMLELAHHDEGRFFEILAFEIEPTFADAPHPIFLTHYPRPMASLARLDVEDPRYALRFELYVRGVELCNGFDELTDPVEQRARFVADREARIASGRPAYPLDERFLQALEEGMPPSAGNALGFDRLVMLALEKASIEDVLAFPHAEL